MTMPVPKVTLRIECEQTNPPKPIGGGVWFDDKLVAVFSLEQLRAVAAQLVELEAKHSAGRV